MFLFKKERLEINELNVQLKELTSRKQNKLEQKSTEKN